MNMRNREEITPVTEANLIPRSAIQIGITIFTALEWSPNILRCNISRCKPKTVTINGIITYEIRVTGVCRLCEAIPNRERNSTIS
jgi:hypothetical protein